MVQTKKGTANMGIYKVGNNANIANFVCLWKSRLSRSWEVRMSHKIYDQSPGSASGWKEIFLLSDLKMLGSATIKVEARDSPLSACWTKLGIIYSTNGRITVGFYESVNNETLTGGVKYKVYNTISVVSRRRVAELLSIWKKTSVISKISWN